MKQKINVSKVGSLLFVLVLVTMVLPLWSNPIDKNTARKAAVQMLSRVAAETHSDTDAALQKTQIMQDTLQLIYKSSSRNTETADVTASEQKADAAEETVYFYVFVTGNNDGFVIVAADDRVPPVLGFSNTNGFSTDNMPPNLVWWLGEYAKQIQFAIDNNIEPTQETKQLWEQLVGVKENNNDKK
jgi:hypothetical protein